MTNPDIPAETGTTRQFYEALLQTEKASAEYLAKFQDNVLKDLLPFVAKNVPYYRDRLASVFRADGSFDPGKWTKIPILSAAEFRANHGAFLPAVLPPSQGRPARYISSGSTGWPTAIYRSALSEAAQYAIHYRHYRAFKLDLRRPLAMIRAFDATLARSRPEPANKTKIPWTAKWFGGENRGHIESLTIFTPLARQIEWLRGLGEVYLNTPPSNALALARHVARNPGSRPRLLAILTAGEPLTEEIRRQCSEHLGCLCIDLHSNAECGVLACDCPDGEVMHFQPELNRIEILARNGKPARIGEWGRIIVTPLYNFAMPLIRYDTGDLVRVAPPCGCGRRHQAIERGVGRPSNMFYLPRRKWFRPQLDTAEMEKLLGNNRWQLVQTGASAFVLHYMPIARPVGIEKRTLLSVLRKALGPHASIQIKPLAALGPASSGKFLAISNHARI